MVNKKRQLYLEHTISFFAWLSGLLVSLVVGYALIHGPLSVPEILPGNLFSNILGWAIILTAVVTVILSFFRK
ncbi:hypothetical protein GW931_02730 [archaeon]|nr:hypothetical protein [archaeon]